MKQHIIPNKSHLKFFVCEDGVNVHCYDRKFQKYRESPPGRLTKIPDFYSETMPDGSKKHTLEDMFSKIENKAKRIILDKGLDKNKAGGEIEFEEQEKVVLAEFICCFLVRVQNFRKWFERKWEDMAKETGFIKTQNDYVNYIRGVFHGDYTPRYKRLASVLMSMDWQLTFTSKKRGFITSDNPFFLNDKKNFGRNPHVDFSRAGIASNTFVKGIPLTPTCCLLIFAKGTTIDSFKLNDLSWVRRVNTEVAANSTRFVIAHNKSLLEKIVKQTILS